MKFLNKDGVTYLWGKIKTALNGKQDTLTFDSAPTANSDNPVKSGGVKGALDGKKNTQTAVSSPSSSGNALAFIDMISQNEQGVIAATKKSVTVDTTPTANSTNPVTSGGVKAALDGKLNTIGKGVNLLDNWYFGAPSYTINSRGKTTYTTIPYNIDRWRTSGNCTITVNADHLAVTMNRYVNFLQFIEKSTKLCGKTVTLTILKRDNSAITVGFMLQNASPSFKQSTQSNTLVSFTTTIPEEATWIYPFFQSTHGTDTYEFIAAKLELGDTQTLAHQENGVWVLNDPPPNYNMELLKCQLSTVDPSDTYANRKLIPITANMGTVTGTGSTVTVTKIVTGVTSNMTVDRIEFGTPSAVQSGWTVTTTTNSVTFSAKISGSTTVKVKLSDNIDVTGT